MKGRILSRGDAGVSPYIIPPPSLSHFILQLTMTSDRSVSRGRDLYVRENQNLTILLLTHCPMIVLRKRRGRQHPSIPIIGLSRCQTCRWPRRLFRGPWKGASQCARRESHVKPFPFTNLLTTPYLKESLCWSRRCWEHALPFPR